MNSCARTQPQSLVRGSSKQVFTDGHPARYYCVGAQPGRAERGVQSGLYKLKYGFPCSDWDTLLNLLQRAEYAFDMFGSTDMIRHIVEAKKRVPYPTMAPSPSSSTAKHSARDYNGVGFGLNVFLRCHVDNDFTIPSCRCTWIDCITRMILSYATFAFPELELLSLSDLAIFLCLIRRNHIAYRLGANQTIRCILSPATLKPVWLD